MGSVPAILFSLVSIFICVLAFPHPFKKEEDLVSESRHARNLYQFGSMIACSTNRSMWDYYDYGCWCGYGGSGHPVDGTDSCCLEHDICYDLLVINNICASWWSTYSYLYLYSGCRQCQPESKYPLEEPEKRCKKALCECDSKAAKCFSEATFNTSYTDYDTSKC